jgi:NAD(P)-dependent dehydrogenase (short-subunit alcohol dehydrogenase family)
MRFENKVVAVTGGSLGIGRAAVEGFAREGAKVAIISNDPERGEVTVQELSDYEVGFFSTDVGVESDVRATMEAITQRWGAIDVLVNNAGIYMQADVVDTALEDWERIMRVNLTGAFLCTKYAVPGMIEKGRGVVVNVSSEAGLVGIKGQVAYNVSKASLISLTQSCAVDLAAKGVRVNCVCPGTTDTPLVREAVARSPDPAAARRNLESMRPLDRLGRPEEIAEAILYLSSDLAGYATGAVLSVDGGYVAQ